MTLVFCLLAGAIALIPWLDMTFLVVAEDASGKLAAAGPALTLFRRTRGRPRKFSEPSRTITLTLPESVLEMLAGLHTDVSQAIVRLARRSAPRLQRKAADLLVFGQRAVITIRPTPSLELRAGVQLVPLPDGRALISFEEPTSLAALQLSLSDALEDPRMKAADRAVYENLLDILREARRSQDVRLEQRHIIVIEARPTRRTNGKNSSRKVSKISA